MVKLGDKACRGLLLELSSVHEHNKTLRSHVVKKTELNTVFNLKTNIFGAYDVLGSLLMLEAQQ